MGAVTGVAGFEIYLASFVGQANIQLVQAALDGLKAVFDAVEFRGEIGTENR